MIRLHKDRRLFLQQNGRSPNTNLRYAECMSLKREIDGFGGDCFRSRLISSLKLPVGWLDFLRKSPREWWEGGEFSWKVGLKVAATMIAASGEA